MLPWTQHVWRRESDCPAPTNLKGARASLDIHGALHRDHRIAALRIGALVTADTQYLHRRPDHVVTPEIASDAQCSANTEPVVAKILCQVERVVGHRVVAANGPEASFDSEPLDRSADITDVAVAAGRWRKCSTGEGDK
jgi:hypothetical protein